MSNLDNLIRKLIDDARSKAEEIQKDADKIRDKIINEKLQKADEERRKIIHQASKEAEGEKNHIISSANLKARDMLISAKQQLIDKAFEAAREKLMNMPDELYAEFFRNNINSLKLNGNELALVPDNRRELVESLGCGISVSNDESVKSGFVIIDGNIRINFTFEALLDLLRDSLESDIARLLFEPGQQE